MLTLFIIYELIACWFGTIMVRSTGGTYQYSAYIVAAHLWPVVVIYSLFGGGKGGSS
jgi:hypothetical protein